MIEQTIAAERRHPAGHVHPNGKRLANDQTVRNIPPKAAVTTVVTVIAKHQITGLQALSIPGRVGNCGVVLPEFHA